MNSLHEKVVDKKWYIILPVLLALVTTLVYYPSLFYPFQFDDIHNIQKFFHLRFVDNLTAWAFGSCRWISYWLNALHYHWDKLEPFVYRRSNLIFHIITGLSVFFVTILALSGYQKKNFFSLNALPIAFFTALLFLLHPVQTQTVSYVIQGQLEGLANLFIMVITLSYFLFCKSNSLITKALPPSFFSTAGRSSLSSGPKNTRTFTSSIADNCSVVLTKFSTGQRRV